MTSLYMTRDPRAALSFWMSALAHGNSGTWHIRRLAALVLYTARGKLPSANDSGLAVRCPDLVSHVLSK